MRLAVVAASDQCAMAFRVVGASVEERSLDTTVPNSEWTQWGRAPFESQAVAVAAISGWDTQIELFVLDAAGQVWNRWWWLGRGWTPTASFNLLGTPFPDRQSRDLAACSAGGGHFMLCVQHADGTVATLPHVNGPDGPFWLRCHEQAALGDGWWPAFGTIARPAYPDGSPTF